MRVFGRNSTMRKPANCVLVIFGASGDLTHRKLMPALYNLYRRELMPDQFAVVGTGRTKLSDDDFRANMAKAINAHSDADCDLVDRFLDSVFYQPVDTTTPDDFHRLKARLTSIDKTWNTEGNYLYYLSTPPSLFTNIVENLGGCGLQVENDATGWSRLIVEKPFGTDLTSARALNRDLQRVFNESQIYRIDHYLGKETVQNLLVFRFGNGIFEPLWNRNYIDRIEVTAAESIGVGSRGGYYDQAGALRDMVQNHLLQVVGMIAMEPPSSFEADAVRNETLKVFDSIRPLDADEVAAHVVRGQYTVANVAGEQQPGYRDEEKVAAESKTETYAAVKLHIDNWRWGGVPFYIRSGKRLPTRVTEAVIHFKQAPHHLFGQPSERCVEDNQLVLRIQPDEGILVKFNMKLPGSGFQTKAVNMDFHYSDLSHVYVPEAYERLLLDCMLGDATLYARGDAVEACWEFVQPILDAWKSNPNIKVFGYPGGTWGPREATALYDRPGDDWRYPCKNLTDDGEYCEL
jgi:glucose-6-phosphate 1-dehydrogenase